MHVNPRSNSIRTVWGRRTHHYLYPHNRGYEKLANRVAPVTVYKTLSSVGATTVTQVGGCMIVAPGAGSPTRGMPVAMSIDGGGTTMNLDWFDAVELAQKRAVRKHTVHLREVESAKKARSDKRDRKKNGRARAKRVRRSRREGRR